MKLSSGDRAPDFTAVADDEKTISLSQFLGKKVILYFYPKDDTPGCTTEACDFAQHALQLSDNNTIIIGVSKDGPKSHQAFKAKYQLPFILLSDVEGKLCEQYGAWGKKVNYGKAYEGIIRSTFLINEKGVVAHAWYNVKAQGHVEKILKEINQ